MARFYGFVHQIYRHVYIEGAIYLKAGNETASTLQSLHEMYIISNNLLPNRQHVWHINWCGFVLPLQSNLCRSMDDNLLRSPANRKQTSKENVYLLEPCSCECVVEIVITVCSRTS